MIKNTQKNTQKRNKWNSLVVNKLSEKYGFTGYYIRQCLKGERNSQTSDTIRKEYKELVLEIENTLNK
jgi:hypothetical protein